MVLQKFRLGNLAGRAIVVLLKFDDSFSVVRSSAICYAIWRSCCFTVLNKACGRIVIRIETAVNVGQYSPSYSYSFWCKGFCLFLTLTLGRFPAPSPVFQATPYWRTNQIVPNSASKTALCIIKVGNAAATAGLNSICWSRQRRASYSCGYRKVQCINLPKSQFN